MDTTKVIMTLLILIIVLSVATVAFNALSGNKTASAGESEGAHTATVGIYVEAGQPAAEKNNSGLLGEEGQ